MNSDSIITTAVLPPTALGTPVNQPVVAAVQVKMPAAAPHPGATPPAAPVAIKPRRPAKKQASSAARA